MEESAGKFFALSFKNFSEAFSQFFKTFFKFFDSIFQEMVAKSNFKEKNYFTNYCPSRNTLLVCKKS